MKRSDWTTTKCVELQPPSEILLEGFILSDATIRYCLHTDGNSRSLCSHLSSSLPFNPFLTTQLLPPSHSIHFCHATDFYFCLSLSFSPLRLDISFTLLPLCYFCSLLSLHPLLLPSLQGRNNTLAGCTGSPSLSVSRQRRAAGDKEVGPDTLMHRHTDVNSVQK